MKALIVLSLLLNSCWSLGASVQLGFGGLTPHFVDQKKNYCNQWNDTGIIANKSYYLRVMGETYGLTYMQGNDSICSYIEGLFVHYLFEKSEWYDMGITAGGYSFIEENWEEHARDTPNSIAAPH